MSEPQRKYVKVIKQDGIAWTYLNRPEKRNAMSPALHREMAATLDELEEDPDTKVVVIAGAGGNFSAGQDLKEYFRANEGKPAQAKKARPVSNGWQWDRLYMFDKPTIAMVEGYCVGGAFSHFLATDFAIVAEDATFSLSEVNWGILPGGMVSKAFADAVLLRHALYYACLGEAFDGKEAVRIGIANFAVPKETLEDEVTKLAKKLMTKSPAALRAPSRRSAWCARWASRRRPTTCRRRSRRCASTTPSTPTRPACSSSSTRRATSRSTSPSRWARRSPTSATSSPDHR